MSCKEDHTSDRTLPWEEPLLCQTLIQWRSLATCGHNPLLSSTAVGPCGTCRHREQAERPPCRRGAANWARLSRCYQTETSDELLKVATEGGNPGRCIEHIQNAARGPGLGGSQDQPVAQRRQRPAEQLGESGLSEPSGHSWMWHGSMPRAPRSTLCRPERHLPKHLARKSSTAPS